MELRQQLILRVLEEAGRQMSTALVKLVYLVDYVHYQHYGETVTGFHYCWDHYGPNAVGHGIVREANELAYQGLIRCHERPNVYGGTTSIYWVDSPSGVRLTPEAEQVLSDTLAVHGGLSLNDLIEVSKQTEPFQRIGQYQIIEMEQTAPAAEEWSPNYETVLRELDDPNTLVTLEELQERWVAG